MTAKTQEAFNVFIEALRDDLATEVPGGAIHRFSANVVLVELPGATEGAPRKLQVNLNHVTPAQTLSSSGPETSVAQSLTWQVNQ